LDVAVEQNVESQSVDRKYSETDSEATVSMRRVLYPTALEATPSKIALLDDAPSMKAQEGPAQPAQESVALSPDQTAMKVQAIGRAHSQRKLLGANRKSDRLGSGGQSEERPAGVGAWQKIWDATNEAYYFFHSSTGESQWERPGDYEDDADDVSVDAAAEVPVEYAQPLTEHCAATVLQSKARQGRAMRDMDRKRGNSVTRRRFCSRRHDREGR
jgi:hypothetical protein